MQAVLCDICEGPIRNKAFEIHIIRGEAVHTEQGRPRIAQRGGAQMNFLCGGCGDWVLEAMAHLKQAHLTAAEKEPAGEPPRRQTRRGEGFARRAS